MPSTSPLAFTPPHRFLLTIVLIVALVGTALSVRVFLYSRHVEDLRIDAEFTRRAEVRNALTREVLTFY